jgi:NAD(P)-dependent dehydrogenase (short-subunit alcohol dehydrogenase family)
MNRPVMLITGAGRGIGAATALLAAEAGYDVLINYAQDHAAAQALAKKAEALGAKAKVVQANVAIEAEVLAMFAQLDGSFGRLDVLVNNAGIVGVKSPIKEMSVARWQNMFGINILGSFICAREAIKRMERAGPGDDQGLNRSIINVSSAAARLGSPNEYVDYAASKGAIDTMTLGLAKELASQGIRVNAVRPGLIDTDIHASGGQPDRIERFKSVIPMQRGGSAAEVARAILWLASREASYVTGSLLDVAGGR